MNILVHTEKEFDAFFESIGYSRVQQDVGSSPNFSNADYVNKTTKTLVELKILNKEFFPKGGIIDSLQALILQPKEIKEDGTGQYEFTLPDINREGRNDNFEEPLRRVLKKANKQLKATKAYYNDSSFTSYVVIAQVGLESLSPEVTAQLIRKLISLEFRSINGVIICVPYNKTMNPFTQRQNPECISLTNELDINLKRECMDIADSWIGFLESGGHQNISGKY